MLRWRLILGILVVAVLAVLCWLDADAERPGIYLVPLALVLAPLATSEMSGLYRQQCDRPPDWILHGGTILPVLASCMPIFWPAMSTSPVGRLGWLAGGLAAAILVTLVGHMGRFPSALQESADPKKSDHSIQGRVIYQLSLSFLAIGYVGGLLGFIIQLRLLGGGPWGDDGRWGLVAWLSLILVVKLSDIGQYTAGHLWGGRFFKRRLAPTLSPGKTWEGAVGGMAMAVLGAVLALGPLARLLGCVDGLSGASWWGGLLAYGLLVGIAGICGDLSESMLKRSAGVKDSSHWLPGFGGVLDLLDSLLVAAPVAYACWLMGLVGPR